MKFTKNIDPWDVEGQKNKPTRTQMRPKRIPESLQDQRCDQRDPEKVSRGGPKAPEAPQRPTKAEKYEKPIVKLMCLRKNIKFRK